jgi:uncharacterized membrane protein YfcA
MDFDYTTAQVLAILATYIFAATAKGVTGLGFSTTCLPFLVMAVGLKEALPLVIIPSICTNLVVMRKAGRFSETIKRFWPMLLATIPGLFIGLWALNLVDGRMAAGVLGLILLLWCVFSYAKPDLKVKAQWEARLAPISGFITGIVNGITGSQVMPSMPFLMALHLDRNLFIQAINCSFTLSSIIMIFGLSQLGLFSADGMIVSIAGTCFAFFGLNYGEKLRQKLSADTFRIALLLMLASMGIGLLFRAF